LSIWRELYNLTQHSGPAVGSRPGAVFPELVIHRLKRKGTQPAVSFPWNPFLPFRAALGICVGFWAGEPLLLCKREVNSGSRCGRSQLQPDSLLVTHLAGVFPDGFRPLPRHSRRGVCQTRRALPRSVAIWLGVWDRASAEPPSRRTSVFALTAHW